MRPIDADALKDSMKGEFTDHIEEFRAITIVNDTPTIDAVSVVRCKDCSYWASNDLSVNWCLSLLTNTKADDYCSYGERSE